MRPTSTLSILLLPALAAAAPFRCTTQALGDEPTATTCCRESEAFGLSACEHVAPRDLVFAFDVPTVHSGVGIVDDIAVAVGGRYGVLAPDPDDQWGGNRSILLSMLMGAALSVVIYHAILSPKVPRFVRASASAAIVAVLALAPYYYVHVYHVPKSAVRWPFNLSMFLFLLRTLEAFFGFTPEGARKSCRRYCLYFFLPVELVYDAKTSEPVEATKRDALQSVWKVVYTMFLTTVLFSFLCNFDYTPFGPTKAGLLDGTAGIRDYFDPRHLGNSFLISLWFQQSLAYGDVMMGFFMHSLVGYKRAPMMDSPILKATSPGDFWSKRWNYLVHLLLKRGIYKPFRSCGFSVFAATLGTFVVSGMMHEWINHAGLVYHRTNIPEAALYKPSNIRLGSNFLFFAYGLIPIAIEKTLSKIPLMRRLGLALPRPLRVSIVLMTTLPLASLFVVPYHHGRMFLDYEGLFYTVFKME